MPAYPRAELEEMVERWLEANRQGEAKKDWRHMADLYTEDATYGWNVGPNDEFMAVGREEIREIALSLEMAGLEGWTYPYQKVLIDEASRARSSVCGSRWPTRPKADGTNYEIAGLGGSWFRYGGDFQWSWQRDFFDVGNAGAAFLAMIKDGTLLPGMQQRMERAMAGERLPGHYPLGGAPVGLWEVPPGGVDGPKTRRSGRPGRDRAPTTHPPSQAGCPSWWVGRLSSWPWPLSAGRTRHDPDPRETSPAVLSILFALLSAFSNATTAVLQRLASVSRPEATSGWWRTAQVLVRDPRWLLGLVFLGGTFVFQAIALYFGQLAVVQPILVTELIFTLALRRLWLRDHITPRTWTRQS